MADQATSVTPGPEQTRRRLGPGLTAFVVIDILLVLTFVVLFFMTRADGAGDPDAQPGPVATTPAPETSPEQSAPAEPEESQALPAFVLPSGNIWCTMDETTATCTIVEFSFDTPALPEGCTGAVGNVLTVTAGEGARFECMAAAATPAPEGTPVLDYGGGSTVGEMTCLSSRNGVFCRHNPSGAGFSLARAGTQIF